MLCHNHMCIQTVTFMIKKSYVQCTFTSACLCITGTKPLKHPDFGRCPHTYPCMYMCYMYSRYVYRHSVLVRYLYSFLLRGSTVMLWKYGIVLSHDTCYNIMYMCCRLAGLSSVNTFRWCTLCAMVKTTTVVVPTWEESTWFSIPVYLKSFCYLWMLVCTCTHVVMF